MVVPYQRFGLAYRSHLQAFSSPGSFILYCLTLEFGTRQVDPKRRYGSTIIRSVKFHKSADLFCISAETFNHALHTIMFTLRFNPEVNTRACIGRDVLSVTLVRSQFKRSCIARGGAGLFTGAPYLL